MDLKSFLILPREHRWAFLALLVLIGLVLALIDIFLIPMTSESIQSSLSGYVRATVGTILVSLLMYWVVISFLPSMLFSRELDQIEPTKITSEFENLLADALRWRYTGNFGRYLRGKVLPTLSNRRNMQISVSIIDPENGPLCEKHAAYRNSINSIDKGRFFDADTVALEVTVTIIHCAWHVANTNTSIELYLLSMYDPLRIDASDNAMILTVEDRRRPALRLTKTHFMYEHFDLQMQNARKQGRKIDLHGFPNRMAIGSIGDNDVKTFLSNVGMQALCSRLTASKIAKACREVSNPYED